MPQLVVTSPRTGSISPSVVPPASAFQSPIRILKRSTATGTATGTARTRTKGGDASDNPSATSPMNTAGTTFAERSARYNAARERIFAAGTTEAHAACMGNSKGEGVDGGAAVSGIVRNPKGPEPPAQGPNGQGREGSQGFGKRGSSGQPGRQVQDSSGLGTK